MEEKITEFLKERWGIMLALSAVLLLMLVPAQVGLPGGDYKGCDNDDLRYESHCQYSKIKSITEESDGSMTITAPLELDDGTSDITFHLLKFNQSYSVGNTIFINIAPWDNAASLFIGADSNILWRLITTSGAISYGATARIDLDTMKEVEMPSSATSNHRYYESRGYKCTDDCSGHDAGYEWARDNAVCDSSYEDGDSRSFNEGARAYAEDNC